MCSVFHLVQDASLVVQQLQRAEVWHIDFIIYMIALDFIDEVSSRASWLFRVTSPFVETAYL